jgi:hypothetical protein
MLEFLRRPWPWYVAGPLIGLTPAILLLLGNKLFGISSNLRTICAAIYPRDLAFFRFDWRRSGGWNLAFLAGILVGGFIGGYLLASPEPVAISAQAQADLRAMGVEDFSGLVPSDLFGVKGLLSFRGLVLLVGGGFLVGFGTAYAGGCTSGHGITGLATFQLPSLIAIVSTFAAGILTAYLLVPLIV